MKRKIFICLTIGLLGIIIVKAQPKTPQAKPKWTESQASSIINYGNQLVAFFNRNAVITKNVESTLETYEENKEALSKNEDQSIRSLGSNNTFNIPNRNNAIPTAPASYPDKSVPQLFSECESIFKKMKGNVGKVEDYLKNKTFVADQFAASDKLMEEVKEQSDVLYDKMKLAINKASKLSDEAEMVFLYKSPKKNLLIPMKTDLVDFKAILNELEANSTNMDADFSSVSTKLTSLKSSCEKNKVTEGKDFSKMDSYYKSDVYPRFYTNLLSAITEAEEFVKDADDYAKASDEEKVNLQDRIAQSQNSVYGYYNKAIDAYNTFIKN